VFTENNAEVTEYIISMTEITPTNIFLKLFPKFLIEHISFYTILYATQIGKSYIPTTPNEITIFFAITICLWKSYLAIDNWSNIPILMTNLLLN